LFKRNKNGISGGNDVQPVLQFFYIINTFIRGKNGNGGAEQLNHCTQPLEKGVLDLRVYLLFSILS